MRRSPFAQITVCLGWSLATAIALVFAAVVDQRYSSGLATQGILLLLLLPLTLGLCEATVVTLSFYLWSKNASLSIRNGLLWSLSIAVAFVLWVIVSLFVSRIASAIGLASVADLIGLSLFSGVLLVIYEVLIGLLQWPLLSRFRRRGVVWLLVRPVAFIVAIVTTLQFTAYEGTNATTVQDALLMGIVGGLLKGLGFIGLPSRS